MIHRATHPDVLRTARRLILAWIVAGGACWSSGRAQTVWEFTPYEVTLVVAADTPGRVPQEQSAWLGRLRERLESVAGAAWNLQVIDAPPELARRLWDDPVSLAFDQLDSKLLDADKVILLSVQQQGSLEHLWCRELDVRTQYWGTPAARTVAQPEMLVDEGLRMVLGAFSPLAVIEDVEGKQATLHVKAGALPLGDTSLPLAFPQQLWRAAIRYSDREGKLRRVRPIEWTYLRTTAVEGAKVTCSVHTGLRSPLSERRRGRIEKLAVALRPPGGTTRLLLRAQRQPDLALAGYDIYGYTPDSRKTTLLGRTDVEGGLLIPPGDHPLRMLLVKSGTAVIARLPLVPGVEASLVAPVPDDSKRLEVEGFIVGLQEQLVDIVVRRAMMIEVAQQQIAAGNFPAAQQSVDELRKLPTRQRLSLDLQLEQQRLGELEPRVQVRVDKLFDDTRAVLAKYLDPTDLDRVERDLVLRRSAAEPPSGATPGDAPSDAPPVADASAAPDAAAGAPDASATTPPAENPVPAPGATLSAPPAEGSSPAGTPAAEAAAGAPS